MSSRSPRFSRTRLACVVSLVLTIGSPSSPAEPEPPAGWTLTFSDEFDGPSLDTRRWNPNDPWGVERNGELQAYVPNAFSVKDGILSIEAKRQRAFYDGKTRDYTSGMASTYGKFSQQYGRFEIRAKAPKGDGLWPAFWMLPLPLAWPPEIDILEILGHTPNEVHLTYHWGVSNETEEDLHSNGEVFKGPDFSEDFHVFAVEWSAEALVWFVDGVERHRVTDAANIPHQPMYVLMNLALGGGGWPGIVTEETPLPSRFDIDYVRVYERK